jgi:hypothetical protein
MNKPFEGDTYIKGELIKLRDKFGITSCIETGTQYGSTTLELFDIFRRVVTIENDKNYYYSAKDRFNGLGILPILGGSEYWLNNIREEPCLYYLDAHSNGICPLKQELEIIASKKDGTRQCIAIHDFKNPNHPEFGYDTYDYELCYEEIEPYLKKIYPDGFGYHYNEKADGAKRGIVYIYPLK